MPETSRLLVVDDEMLNRDMLSRRLTRCGYAVEVAENGEQALGMIRRRSVDLILLDSMMPGMSGVDLLKLLRATYSPDELPVIMVTALSDSDRIVEALNLGANDYVTKPVDFPVALARIRSQLARKIAESALRKSEQRYALAVRGTNDGLWDWDVRAGRIHFSPRWKAILGYSEEEIGDTPEDWLSRVHVQDRPGLRALIDAQFNGSPEEQFEHEHRILHRDGNYRWVLVRGTAVRGEDGRIERMAGSQSDVTEKRVFDSLTGLPNRILFNDRLERAFERARREKEFIFAVLFLDLDRFKLVNDSMGHAAGDELLVAIAKRLKSGVRCGDRSSASPRSEAVARLGGDEFAILLENIGQAENATRVAERILRMLREPFRICGKEVFCTISIGIALSTIGYERGADMLRDADTAMYTAKTMGKARWTVFDQQMRERVVASLELENDLRRGIERGELEVHYQPKMHLMSGMICGFEALVRWKHPTRGLLQPNSFIPIAEETGLIVPLGVWVLREACWQMRRWNDQFPSNHPLEMSVNLSVRQFRQPDLVEHVAAILKETGLDPSMLQLELTESVLLESYEAALDALKRLKALGIGLKLDDFGTGYSSLNYLCRLPFDALKIDRSFTIDLSTPDGSIEVVRTILAMAHKLGMDVVAEGIEEKDQLARLQSLGCKFGQGYFFSKPLEQNLAGQLLAAERGACSVGQKEDGPETQSGPRPAEPEPDRPGLAG